MTAAPVEVASAVILPDAEEEPQQKPSNPLKRRQSSISSSDSKRPRLSQDENTDTAPPAKDGSPPQRSDRLSERRKTGQLEERKRGQRLFGALLGTLSQSSSSTAQKRRADIEKKQQDKLRLQAEEEDGKKKASLEILTKERQREQKIYDRQSMRIRHSNMLAQAHFLQTKAEPRLQYYKPWQLLPGDDDRIRRQVQETEEIIAQENGQQDPDVKEETLQPSNDADPANMEIDMDYRKEEDGKKNSKTDPGEPRDHESLTNDDVVLPAAAADTTAGSKDTGDDGGEVVEGEEDTVIY